MSNKFVVPYMMSWSEHDVTLGQGSHSFRKELDRALNHFCTEDSRHLLDHWGLCYTAVSILVTMSV